jgi:hypothetical protein
MKRARLIYNSKAGTSHQLVAEDILHALRNSGHNEDAWLWANAHSKLTSAGSDAHTASQIGGAWTETPWQDIKRPEDLLLALNVGKVRGTWQHPAFSLVSKVKNMAHRASRRLQETWHTNSD